MHFIGKRTVPYYPLEWWGNIGDMYYGVFGNHLHIKVRKNCTWGELTKFAKWLYKENSFLISFSYSILQGENKESRKQK